MILIALKFILPPAKSKPYQYYQFDRKPFPRLESVIAVNSY